MVATRSGYTRTNGFTMCQRLSSAPQHSNIYRSNTQQQMLYLPKVNLSSRANTTLGGGHGHMYTIRNQSRIGSRFPLFFFMFFLVIFLMDLPPAQARALKARVFSGQVSSFQGPLQFTLSCCSEKLAIAMVKPADPSAQTTHRIQAFLRSQVLSCTEFFTQKTTSGQPEHLVWCHSQDGTLISQTLLNIGDAVENCALSANQFGTC